MTDVLALQTAARSQHGKRPFAAVLVGPDHETVLLRHQSVSHVDHAESSLARLASLHYSQAYLWACTMYSTWEPCAMCAATSMFTRILPLLLPPSSSPCSPLPPSSWTPPPSFNSYLSTIFVNKAC